MKLQLYSVGLMAGIVCIFFSLVWMLFGHEFTISEPVFLFGIIITSISYIKLHPEDKPKINTDQVNKNIETYNGILWGKEKEKDPEETVTITIKRQRKP
jgi:hypothetical protein